MCETSVTLADGEERLLIARRVGSSISRTESKLDAKHSDKCLFVLCFKHRLDELMLCFVTEQVLGFKKNGLTQAVSVWAPGNSRKHSLM